MKNALLVTYKIASAMLSLFAGSQWPVLAQAPPPNVKIFHVFANGVPGADPVTPIIQTPDGSLVGVTYGVGNNNTVGGVLYKVSPKGEYSVLHSFPGSGSEGGVHDRYGPASIMQASDQNFYGTFPSYGQLYSGTIYRVTPAGKYQQIHDFNGDGDRPIGPLVEGFDGYLYGVSAFGPGNAPGAIFRVGLDGSFEYVLLMDPNGIYDPNGGLALGSDGNFYGVALLTFYKFDPSARTITALASVPNLGLISNMVPVLGPSYRLYFSDNTPGFCNCPGGAIVSFSADGNDLEFNYLFTEPGTEAFSNLLFAGDGNFYTANVFGSSSIADGVNVASQTVSTYSLGGVGNYLNGSLVQISNGNLAGTTYANGVNGTAAGTLFLLNAGASKPKPFILSFEPQAAGVGQTVTVWGNYFVGTTAVSVNGIPASFHVSAAGFLSFAVPNGAASGPISVSNAGGVSSSAASLKVE